MKTRILALGSAASIALLATGAIAADLPVRAPAPAPVFVALPSWSGYYVGVFGGLAAIRNTTTDISGEEYGDSTAGAKMSLRDNAFFGGATMGYNFQVGSWVFGPEIEIGYLRSDKTIGTPTGDPGLLVNYKGLYGLAGVRVGYAIMSNALLFAKAGVVATRIRSAGGEFDGIGEEDDNGIWGFDGNESAGGTKTRLGFAVGAGLEVALSPNWSVKAEYLYKDFGSKTYQTLVEDIQPFKFRDTAHTVKFGVNYRFGAPARAMAPVVARY